MKLINIYNRTLLKTFCAAGNATKQALLHVSFLLCFLVCNCNVSKGEAPLFTLTKMSDKINRLFPDTSKSREFAPIKGKVISPFGYRGRHNHTGTDIKLHKGDTVRAAFSGQVIKASRYSGYGNLVILKHPNNIETYYAHLSKCLVEDGKTVAAGDVIGLGGCTGRASTPHLHFEVRFNHVPKNPEKFFDFKDCLVKESVLAYKPTLRIEDEPEVKIDTETKHATKSASKNIAKKDTFIVQKSEQSSESTPSTDVVTIQKGDTLYALAKRHGTTVQQLLELNHLENSNLKLGMVLKVK